MKPKYLTLEDIPESMWTEISLKRVLAETRMEKGGISLERIAEIMAGELDWTELNVLSKWLTEHSKKKKDDQEER
ncbi:unnamed protein product [marine sediment metagenome]|uniref:Uncharacterized protein n=1 Tax=marine sediment metagenome TaxID=412755 RepID=X0SUT2_9ZZZZ